VVPTRGDDHPLVDGRFALDRVHQAMLTSDATGPETREVALERLGLAEALEL
jgi:hypothetical protein